VDNDDQLAVRLQNFANFLLRVGNGSEPTFRVNSWIRIPDEIYFPSTSVQDLSRWVFINLTAAEVETRGLDWLFTRAILTPKNTHVRMINDVLLDDFPGDEVVYLSSDTVSDEDDAMTYPVEYLNTIVLGCLPDHHLKLKVGCPVMILRNLNPSNGLCNGTRLIIRSFR
jgi:ATP-dependent DNA helicase PIF1